MSLATRCPVCNTVFRVVQDQLKVSEGWVRCGRCAKVFNAFEGLFDLERELAGLSTSQVSPSQRVLQDLAERNRSPKPRNDWPADDFDTGAAAARAGSRPSAAPLPETAPRPPTAPSRTPGRAPGAAAWPTSQPASFGDTPATRTPGRTPAAPAWPTSQPATFGEPSQATGGAAGPAARSMPAGWSPSQPALGGAGHPASTARAAPGAAAPTAASAAESSHPTATTGVPSVAKPTGGTGAAAPVTAAIATPAATGPAPAGPRATGRPVEHPKAPEDDAVALRAEPLPVKSAGDVADSDDSAGSYESLFRSTGELDAATAHPSSIDIVLDGIESEVVDPGDSRYLSFVQQADQQARWQRPQVRRALAAGASALLLLLVVQLAIGARDLLASRWPSTEPLLSALCTPLGCRVEPLRRIERLAVESSGLTRVADGSPVYRLAMVLRNRGDVPLLLPAVDLSLTDSGGALVTRRVLSAADLGATRTIIAPGQELPLQALLMSAERPVTGYTIEIFYP